MKKSNIAQALLCLFLGFYSLSAFAWDHSIELGYGYSHDPNDAKYNNSGFLLSGDIFPLWRTPWSNLFFSGAIGQWYSSAPVNKYLTTVAVDLDLRFYPFTVCTSYPAYIMASAGPAYLSSREFGTNVQGSHLTFQLFGGLGVEIQHFDLNLRLVHYSNAHLANPDHGFSILYMLSVGYLF